MARPPKEINWDIVERLIEADCSAMEIAGKFRINADTFYRRFKKEYSQSFQDYQGTFHSAGLGDLKAMIHAKSLNNKAPGNATLLMFLGRTRLGLRETDTAPQESPQQILIEQQHRIMKLEAELESLRSTD